MMSVRTRFAPSPTGYLHIGGVRTALFNYLFAKKHGGQFILRIDDTDEQRNNQEALQPILDGLRWLGINWDEGAPDTRYYQSQRKHLYQAAVDKLLANGCAYRDFAKPEEIQAERDAAVADSKHGGGGTFTYSRKWAAETDADVKRFESEGRQGLVRLKMPREGKLVIHDLIRGDVEFDWANEQDHVIERTDGSFIYHLANVVDDEDFRISHVIRAEEHLPNTPRQIFMIQSLGCQLPQYAHLPFVAEPGSKTKLSKRKLDKYLKNKDFAKLMSHGKSIAGRIGLEITDDHFNPVITDFYEQIGYLPEAIVNAMALVGWALDDKTELFTMQELIDAFSLEGVAKGAASFDPAKLFSFQEKHFIPLPIERKIELCEPFLKKAGYVAQSNIPLLRSVIEYAGERIKVAGDILDFLEFFIPDEELPYNEADYEKRITSVPEALPLLKEFAALLVQQTDWTHPALEKTAMDFIAGKGIKPNALIFPLRVATTGKSIGIGMFEALELLGKDRTLKRMGKITAGIKFCCTAFLLFFLFFFFFFMASGFAGEIGDKTAPLTQDTVAAVQAVFGTVSQDEAGHITAVDLANERASATDDSLQKVLQLKGLRSLRIAGGTITAATFAAIKEQTELTDLFLKDMNIGNEDLAQGLAPLTKLKRLTLRRLPKVTVINNAASMTNLSLLEMSFTQETFPSILALKNLTALDLRGSGEITLDNYRSLGQLPKLTDLKIGGFAVNDEVLKVITPLKLTGFAIDDTFITAEGFAEFAANSPTAATLQTLVINKGTLTDDDLAPLNKFSHLNRLFLTDMMITGSFLGHLSADEKTRPKLKYLSLKRTLFDSDEAAALQKFPELTEIDLTGTREGLDKALQAIPKIKK